MATILLIAAIAVAVLVEIVIRRRQPRLKTPADYLRAGDRALQRGQFEEAEQHYRESLRLDHANPEAHYKLSLVAWERRDFQEVVDHLQDCQRWAPEVADVEHGLGAAHYHLGDHEEALRHYHRARELDPENEEVRGNLAALYHELGRPDEGREIWPEYEPPTPEEAERADRMKRVWAKMGPTARSGLRRWKAVVAVLAWTQRVSWGVVLLCGILFVAILVHGTIAQVARARTATDLGTLATVAKIAFAIAMLSLAALNLMHRERGSLFRRVLVHSGISREEAEAVAPPRTGRSWWRTELSGGHPVLWVGLPVLILFWRHTDAFPEWFAVIGIYLTAMWFFKGLFIFSLLTERGERRERWHREYRLFGTARGAVVGLVGIPVVLALAGWLFWQLLELVGL